ncbi:hypothetical protein [Cohnella thailandensis]|uniref:Uncharacterized protein n=1 Tax=Cohnella thailandensis TaxID=557557 RepID=A0A841SWZ1_9BACL|nr:hypothetical protein [Cohnella thailandensis]MBB6633261.1 hypothetical protein [Cohnella thailandensis]MBP1975041.1 putative membrane protein [Cohnella thailandensis]
MKRAFAQVAWGLIFTLVNIRINGFDLLHDLIGYVLILAGLSKLSRHHRGFRIALPVAWIRFVLTIAALFGVRYEVSLTRGESPDIGTISLTALAMVVELVLFYGICDGIRGMALEKGKKAIASRAGSLWRWSFALGALLLFCMPFQLNYILGEIWPILMLFALGLLVTHLLLIFLLFRAGRVFGNYGGAGSDGETVGT